MVDHDPQLSAWNYKGLGIFFYQIRLWIYRFLPRNLHVQQEERFWMLATETHHKPGDGVTTALFHQTLEPLGFEINLYPHNHTVLRYVVFPAKIDWNTFGNSPVRKRSPRFKIIGPWVTALVLGAALIWMANPGTLQLLAPITIAKVPVPIILKFLTDKPARDAYLQKDTQALHDRLVVLGVEEDIKAFYRPQINDEVKLDRYIHQIFYERTGYIGEAYTVNPEGILVLKQLGGDSFDEWLHLARDVGLVTDTREENGVQYVISPAGTVAPYAEIAAIFPLAELRSLAEAKQQP